MSAYAHADDEEFATIADDCDPVPDVVANREANALRKAAVADAIADLPPRWRYVIQSRYFEEVTLRETGARLGVT